MLYAHANTLTDARSYLAALADQGASTQASSAYEHALLELDWLHGDDVPTLDTGGLSSDRDRLSAAATTAVRIAADRARRLCDREARRLRRRPPRDRAGPRRARRRPRPGRHVMYGENGGLL